MMSRVSTPREMEIYVWVKGLCSSEIVNDFVEESRKYE